MKYYSEILNKPFDTIDALETAEREEKNRLVEKAKAEDNKKEKVGRSNQGNGEGLSGLFCCPCRQR